MNLERAIAILHESAVFKIANSELTTNLQSA